MKKFMASQNIRHKSNLEIFVETKVRELKQDKLIKLFMRKVEQHGTEKASLRIPTDILKFYQSLVAGQKIKCSTVMIIALNTIKEALQTGTLKSLF